MKSRIITPLALLTVSFFLANCNSSNVEEAEAQVTVDTIPTDDSISIEEDPTLSVDEEIPQFIREDEEEVSYYHEVKIGTQIWMSSNLYSRVFQNGDIIPLATNADEWYTYCAREEPACCFYLDKAQYGAKYGLLYNFYAVSDPRNIAPKGWKVASFRDWDSLGVFLGGSFDSYEGGQLADLTSWPKPGTNTFDFSAIPSPNREYLKGATDNPPYSGFDEFDDRIKSEATWWTSSKAGKTYDARYGLVFNLRFWSSHPNPNNPQGYTPDRFILKKGGKTTKGKGYPVRCIKE